MFFSFAYLTVRALLGLLARSRRGPDIIRRPATADFRRDCSTGVTEVMPRCQARRQNQALVSLGVPKLFHTRAGWRNCKQLKEKKARICRLNQKPSDGLEPSTPSLPWRIRAGTTCQARVRRARNQARLDARRTRRRQRLRKRDHLRPRPRRHRHRRRLPCVFGPTADRGHKAMRVLFKLKGNVPKHV